MKFSLTFLIAFILSSIFSKGTIYAQYWPTDGTVDDLSSAFGPRNIGFTEYPNSGYDYDFHRGTDIGNTGNVYTILPGTVDQVFSGSKVIVVLNTDGTALRYTHVEPLPNVTNGTPVPGGYKIGTIDPSQAHLDVKYYPSGSYSLFHDAKHPMGVLPYNNNNFSFQISDPILGQDATGRYIEFYVQDDNDELDVNEIKLFLSGTAANGSQYTEANLLRGTFTNDVVNYENRTNIGDIEGQNNSDSGFNNWIRTIPIIFSKDDSYHLVFFRFYLDENLYSQLTEFHGYAQAYDIQFLVNTSFTVDFPVIRLGITEDITSNTTWSGENIVDILGYDSATYPGEKELHLISPYTLTIESGATINLQDHVNFVIDAGATLNIQSGVTCNFGVDAEIIAKGGTINDAGGQCNWNQLACILAEDGGIYRNTSSNTFTIDNGAFLSAQGGTFELPNASTVFESGSYWDIGPGSTIKVANGKSINVKAGAYINAVGTAANSIMFTSLDGTPSRSEWGTIFVYSSNNTFEYCTVEGSDWGIKFYGTPSATTGNVVRNCTVRISDQGIRAENTQLNVYDTTVENNRHAFVLINNSSGIYLDGNTVRNNDRDGIYSINSVVDIFNSTIENNGLGHTSTYHGIWASSSSDIFLGSRNFSYSSGGYNTIKNNHGAGIYRSSNSAVSLGYYITPTLGSGGYNTVFYNGSYGGTYSGRDIYNLNVATTYANKSYWGSSNGPGCCQFYGPVHTNYWLSSPPGSSALFGLDLATNPNGVIADDDTKIKTQLIAQYRALIAKQPESQEAIEAIQHLYSFVRTDKQNKLNERNTIYGYLNGIYQAHPNLTIGEMAFQMMLGQKMSTENYQDAITLGKSMPEHFSKSARTDNLLQLILMYLQTGELTQAKENFEIFKTKFADAAVYIELLNDSFKQIEGASSNTTKAVSQVATAKSNANLNAATVPLQLKLGQNYPNPFNPTTTIQFQLPEAGRVTLKIFNMLGQEVKTLVDGNRQAGLHEITWDAKDSKGLQVPSGIYVYSLRTKDKVFNEKLLLLK